MSNDFAKLPWFRFRWESYFADYRLRTLPVNLKGAWIDFMAIAVGGTLPTIQKIALITGRSQADVENDIGVLIERECITVDVTTRKYKMVHWELWQYSQHPTSIRTRKKRKQSIKPNAKPNANETPKASGSGSSFSTKLEKGACGARADVGPRKNVDGEDA